jgi:hypothetical protein
LKLVTFVLDENDINGEKITALGPLISIQVDNDNEEDDGYDDDDGDNDDCEEVKEKKVLLKTFS